MQKAPRPLSVSVVQFAIIVGILGLIWGEIYVITHWINERFATADLFQQIGFFLFEAAFFLGGSAYLCLTFYGLQKRKPYGRWMAIGLVGFALMANIARWLASVGIGEAVDGPLPRFQPSNEAQAQGQQVGSGLVFVALVLLLVRLIWGQRTKRFFAREGM